MSQVLCQALGPSLPPGLLPSNGEVDSSAGLLNKSRGLCLPWKHGQHGGSGRLGPMGWREDQALIG